MDVFQMCIECRNATYDCHEYYGGLKHYFMDGCRKNLEPYYDEEEECITCEGFKRVEEDL